MNQRNIRFIREDYIIHKKQQWTSVIAAFSILPQPLPRCPFLPSIASRSQYFLRPFCVLTLLAHVFLCGFCALRSLFKRFLFPFFHRFLLVRTLSARLLPSTSFTLNSPRTFRYPTSPAAPDLTPLTPISLSRHFMSLRSF